MHESGARHEVFLREAIQCARDGMRRGGGPFGAVVVRGGEVVGRGANAVTLDLDPTAHAEVVAIREACRALGAFRLDGCALYASCEPCPMCLGAILWARIDHLVYAATREDAAGAGFDDAFLYEQVGLPPERRALPTRRMLRDEAAAVMREWAASARKRPY